MTLRRRGRGGLVAVLVASVVLASPSARADGDEPPAGAASAAIHFRHGVDLYKDVDYAGAIAEFRRAQELSPNYKVLYNIGQALYELQRYAEALRTFEDYLAQGGDHIPAARRATVEKDLKALRDRVGYLDITVNVEGAEVRVDDQAAGTSPLAGPVLVSVGHRKVTVVGPDRTTVERFIDVASGDHAKVDLDLPVPEPPRSPAQPLAEAPSPPEVLAPPPAPIHPLPEPSPAAPRPPRVLAWIPWITTVPFAVGTVVTGVLALDAKSALSKDLSTFPGSGDQIASDRSRARTFAVASDILLVTTVVSAGTWIYLTLRSPKGATVGAVGTVRVGLAPAGVRLAGDF